jgi:hypothetical protein
MYRYFVNQSSEFCRHNPLCCFSTSVYCCKRIFRNRLSTETFGYTLAFHSLSMPLRCTVVIVTLSNSWTYRSAIHRRPWEYLLGSYRNVKSLRNLKFRHHDNENSSVTGKCLEPPPPKKKTAPYLLNVFFLEVPLTIFYIHREFYGSIPGGGWEFFSSPLRPERLWVPPSLLSSGYQGLFPFVQSGRGVKLTTPSSSAEVKECVELYIHFPIHLHGVVLSWKRKHRDNFTFTFR